MVLFSSLCPHTCNILQYCYTTQQEYTVLVDTPTTKLGRNIKRIRERKQMSQGDICRATGFDRAQMSNIESGNGNPTFATIDKIAKALGVLSDKLLR